MRTVGTTITIAAPPATVWGMIVAFDKYHEFLLEPEGAGTKMRHREYFSGILVLFLKKTLARTEEGFHALNRALKQRAETAAGVRRVE
jgi:hypothetical protein